jgi:CTP synthase (UTP-ammonia lyase)
LVVNETELDDVNVYDKVMQAFISKQFEDIIQAVNELNSPDNMYTFLYKNAQKYFEKNFAKAIVIIAKYQHMSDSVRDKNLNLAACMFELSH